MSMLNVVLVDKRGVKVATVAVPDDRPPGQTTPQSPPGVVTYQGKAYVRNDRGQYLETRAAFLDDEPEAVEPAPKQADTQEGTDATQEGQ